MPPTFNVKTFETEHEDAEKQFKCEISNAAGEIVTAGHGTSARHAEERAKEKLDWPEGTKFVKPK